MRMVSRPARNRLLAILAAAWATPAASAPLPAAPVAQPFGGVPVPVLVADRRYADDDYYYSPEYDLPPPPVVRVYPDAPPPAAGYEPPVYGWLAPPRPASCGKYRYWNGEYCADARRDPPYIGPRW